MYIFWWKEDIFTRVIEDKERKDAWICGKIMYIIYVIVYLQGGAWYGR